MLSPFSHTFFLESILLPNRNLIGFILTHSLPRVGRVEVSKTSKEREPRVQELCESAGAAFLQVPVHDDANVAKVQVNNSSATKNSAHRGSGVRKMWTGGFLSLRLSRVHQGNGVDVRTAGQRRRGEKKAQNNTLSSVCVCVWECEGVRLRECLCP